MTLKALLVAAFVLASFVSPAQVQAQTALQSNAEIDCDDPANKNRDECDCDREENKDRDECLAFAPLVPVLGVVAVGLILGLAGGSSGAATGTR